LAGAPLQGPLSIVFRRPNVGWLRCDRDLA
jgi:hypothetical protein